MSTVAGLAEDQTRINVRQVVGATVALTIAAFALVLSGTFGPEVVKSIITAAGVAEAGVAVAIVDAVLAGSAVATVVAAFIGLGVGGAVVGGIRWAIATFGRKQAIE